MKIPFLRNHESRICFLEKALETASPEESSEIYEQLAMEYISKNDSRTDAINARDCFVKAGYVESKANKKVISEARKRLKFPILAEMYANMGDYELAARAELNCLIPFTNVSLFYGLGEVIARDASYYFEKAGMFKEAAEAWNRSLGHSSPGEADLYVKAGDYRRAARIYDECGYCEEAMRLMKMAKD